MSERIEIAQKRGRQIRKYQVQDDGVKSEVKTDGTYHSLMLKFEDIEFDEIIVDRKPNPVEMGFFLSVLFNLIFAVILLSDWFERMQVGTIVTSSMLMGVVSGMSVWAYTLFRFDREKILKGPKNIFLFYSEKDQAEVDNFIDLLKSKQKEYFRKMYMDLDDTSDLWAYEGRLKWLLDKKFIEKEEYKYLKEEISNRRLLGD
ncbi:hypothetical protein [uncultured Imperialibacter sp.]|uniref:hypothetical protein n=1 Tax=uncultured Imperialibacter sp. TaxID=1672639 RepID=UPI0030D79EFA|tara:strand:- start:57 stop:662 length:606 start_codon:yes stop_codon:yes gene_type:complete